MALKIFQNIGSSRKSSDYAQKLDRLESRRLETTLIKEAYEVLQPPVVAACFEVSQKDLNGMLEIMAKPSITDKFNIIQQEVPNQFVISRKESDWLD